MSSRVLVLLALAGCFSKPDPPSESDGDAPVARLIRNAWWSAITASPNMTNTAFSISTEGIMPGDLVVFIANVDNGAIEATTVPSPMAPGFAQVDQRRWGIDMQTLSIQYKFVTEAEPTEYTGTYKPGSTSGAATISLIAIRGADPVDPIRAVDIETRNGRTGSADGHVDGLTTPVADCLLLYTSGGDWYPGNATASFTLPAGYTLLTELGDRGLSGSYDWSTTQISFAVQGAAGATGPVQGITTGLHSDMTVDQSEGMGALLAIAPAP